MKILQKLKQLPRQERAAYFWISLIVVILLSGVTMNQISGREYTQTSGWCSELKGLIDPAVEQGMSCGLKRDGSFITLGEADTLYANVYCELLCYNCEDPADLTPVGEQMCDLNSQYVKQPIQEAIIDKMYDGQDDSFFLEYVSTPLEAYRNEEVKISIKVQNTDVVRGSMKVQCSMLDPNTHSFLQSVTPVNIQNCVRGETFTQTKYVELAPAEIDTITFNPIAPNTVGTYTIFCEAFEQCWEDGLEDYGASSTLNSESIIILERPVTSAPIDPDEVTGGMFNFDFENPFTDLTAWWSNKSIYIQVAIVFSGIFLIMFVVILVSDKNKKKLVPY